MDEFAPITNETREQATEALLRAALFYRTICREVAESHPEATLEAMGTEPDGPRWQAAKLADAAIDQWRDYLEVRDGE